jgi:hypothetical protein
MVVYCNSTNAAAWNNHCSTSVVCVWFFNHTRVNGDPSTLRLKAPFPEIIMNLFKPSQIAPETIDYLSEAKPVFTTLTA